MTRSAADGALPRKVLIVGANYWPEENGNAPYTTGFAEDLAAHGSQVTVLTAVPHYPRWRISDGYRGRLRIRETRNGVRIIRSWLWVPRHQSAVQRAVFEATFGASSLTATGLGRPDVVIGVIPSLSGGVLARTIARRSRVPYGVIVQDLVGPGAVQSGMSGGRRVARAVRKGEAWALGSARGVAIVSEAFAPYVEGLGVPPDRIRRIRNWANIAPSTEDRAAVRRRLGWDPETPVVLHAGAMGLKQGLEQVVAAAREADVQGADLRFVIAGDGSQRAALHASARELRNLEFLPPQDDTAYANLLLAADVLLISERPEMVDMSLPGKLTSYASAARPIVAAVPTEGATAREIEEAGCGLVTPAGDPAALVAAIERVVADPTLAASLSDAGKRYASEILDESRCLAELRSFVADLVAPSESP